jgi:hypothetical protein
MLHRRLIFSACILLFACGEENPPVETELVALPVLLVATEGLTYAHVTRACSDERKRFCVENRAVQAIDLDAIELEQHNGGGDFSISKIDGMTVSSTATNVDPANLRGTVINPGARLCFEVEYAPKTAGIHSAFVNVRVQGFLEPLSIEIGGTSDANDRSVDSFAQGLQTNVDFLFVLDNSPAMSDIRERVYDQLEQMFSVIELRFNYRVAITTTDPSRLGTLRPIGVAGEQFISKTTVDPAEEFARAIRAPESTTLSEVLAFEAAFQVYRSRIFVPRPDATLVTIFVSDRDDTSDGSPELFGHVFSALIDTTGQTSMAMSFVRSNFDPFQCWAANPPSIEGSRFIQLGFGIPTFVDSVCSDNYSGALFNLPSGGDVSFFTLRQPPKQGTIEVTIKHLDGTETAATGWRYEESFRAVVFDFVPPPRGTTVEISYEVSCG